MDAAVATGFGEFLAQSGAVAGGGTAWGVGIGLVVGAFASDSGLRVDRWRLASQGGALGALFGLSVVATELLS
jgi:hypothetical protein